MAETRNDGRRHHRRGDDQRGSATLLVLSAAGILLTLCLVLAVSGRLFLSHRQARTAADLAALAGASTLQREGDGCAAARAFAARNGAMVESCLIDNEEVVLHVRVEGPRFRGRSWQLRARARAGPEPN